MNDVRYSELKFLQMLASDATDLKTFYDPRGERSRSVGLSPSMYVDLAATLVEDGYVRFREQHMQLLVARLRGELSPGHGAPSPFQPYQWSNPRAALHEELGGARGHVYELELTYRGLRRIEELREILKRDRILEPFGVLLSMQYFSRDLEDALRLHHGIAVSVLYADMDKFKPINTEFGQSGGDVVMKAYLEMVRDTVGDFGTGYRGVGDEVAILIIGQGHDKAIEFAERIRAGVGDMRCDFKGKALPKVTATIGVASTPPEQRTMEIETLAEDRKRGGKDEGRNRVVAK